MLQHLIIINIAIITKFIDDPKQFNALKLLKFKTYLIFSCSAELTIKICSLFTKNVVSLLGLKPPKIRVVVTLFNFNKYHHRKCYNTHQIFVIVII